MLGRSIVSVEGCIQLPASQPTSQHSCYYRSLFLFVRFAHSFHFFFSKKKSFFWFGSIFVATVVLLLTFVGWKKRIVFNILSLNMQHVVWMTLNGIIMLKTKYKRCIFFFFFCILWRLVHRFFSVFCRHSRFIHNYSDHNERNANCPYRIVTNKSNFLAHQK